MKSKKELKGISKLLAVILRHKPEIVDVSMDIRGWVSVNELINMVNKKYEDMNLTFEDLESVVNDADQDNQRYSFNDDNTKIRARQGHSLDWVIIELEDVTKSCPGILYHGTSEDALDDIFHPNKGGIKKMSRNHVHLSDNVEGAKKVGARHGKPVVLEVLMRDLAKDGYRVFKSENDRFLMEEVPLGYFRKLQ